MDINPSKLGYSLFAGNGSQQMQANPSIRLKSVSKNHSLSKLISPNKKLSKLSQKQVSFDYLLFVFTNQKDSPQIKAYLSSLKTNTLTNSFNIVFFKSILQFLNLFKQAIYNTCHKRFALLIGQEGILSHKRTFNQIHQIHVMVDSKEEYSKMKHLLDDSNVMSIIYDISLVDKLLFDINVMRAPSLICSQKSSEIKDFVQRINVNEENKQNSHAKWQKPSESLLPTNSKKIFSISQLGYENRQHILIDKEKSGLSIHKQKPMELPYESTLKREEPNPITIKINQTVIFTQYYSNFTESEQNQASSYESQIRKVALGQKMLNSADSQGSQNGVKKCGKKDAELWYKRYASSKQKGLNRYKKEDRVMETSSAGFRSMAKESCSYNSSSNSGSKWYSQYRRSNNSKWSNFNVNQNERQSESGVSCTDEYELTNHLWK